MLPACVQELSLQELSGWRDEDKERIFVLKGDFRGGKYGLTVTGGIWILEKTDSDGKRIVDDGRSTVGALTELKGEYNASPECDPETKEPWDAKLVKVLQGGTECKVAVRSSHPPLC